MSTLDRWWTTEDSDTSPLVSERSLLVAVFLFHGVVDGALTGFVHYLGRGTGMEANPWMSALTTPMYLWLTTPGEFWTRMGVHAHADAIIAVAVLALKVLIVGSACLLASRLIPNTRLYRAWLAAIALSGVLLALNNLSALA